jgi:type IV secretory pathway VirB4 component
MPLLKDTGNVQDLVLVKDIRKNTVILKNGGLRQIVMVSGINFALKSEDEQNIITQSYQNFLNSLNFPLQIVIHSRKINIERYVASLDTKREEESASLLRDQIGEYQEFIRGFIKDNDIMAKTFLVVVPYSPIVIPTPSSGALGGLPFFGKKKTPADTAARAQREQASFDESILQLAQRVQQVIQGLTTVGLECVVLNDEQLVELFYNFYNPESVEKEKIAAAPQSTS